MAITRGPKIVRDGLVLYLDAGDRNSYPGSGTTWKDLSGNGNNGALTNGPTFDSGNGGSLVFDGVDDYISTDYDLSWNDNSHVTINIIVKPSTLVGNYPFLGKGPSLWEWQFNQVGTSFQHVYWNTGGGHSNGPTTSISNFFENTNDFVFISLVWNSSDNKYYLYKNGSLFYTINWVDASINQNRSNGINLGGNIYRWSLASNYWPGSIALFSVYMRSLSDSEIQQNYNATKGRFNL